MYQQKLEPAGLQYQDSSGAQCHIWSGLVVQFQMPAKPLAMPIPRPDFGFLIWPDRLLPSAATAPRDGSILTSPDCASPGPVTGAAAAGAAPTNVAAPTMTMATNPR